MLLTLASVGIYSSAFSVSVIENDKNSKACVQQKKDVRIVGVKRERERTREREEMRSSCTDSFKPDCLILIAVQPTKLLF